MTCWLHSNEKAAHLDCAACRADLARPRKVFTVAGIRSINPDPQRTPDERRLLQYPAWFLAWDDGVRH